MSLLRAGARLRGGLSGGFTVRQRLLGIVLVAALVFAAVAAVSSVSSSSVGRTAENERRVVALKESYLLSDALLAKLRGGVHEVVATQTELAAAVERVDEAEAEEGVEEYAEIRREFEDLVVQTLRDVPEGPLVAAAYSIATQGRAALATADAAVLEATVNPLTAMARLDEMDAQTDALDEALNALIVRLAALQTRAIADTISSREGSARAVMLTSALGILVLFVLALLAASSILRGLRSVTQAADRLADGDFDARFEDTRRDEIGTLGGAFNATADSLRGMMRRLEEQGRRDSFGRQLNEALEMADTEDQTYDAISRSLPVVSTGHPIELLVADSSRAHLAVRAEHPHAGAPGCPVESPFGCVAVRRGTTTTFADSQALNACPKLRDRSEVALSAVCVPVTFMGRALGVLHATAPVDAPLEPEEVTRLATVASAAGARIGTVRSFERTQLQASTDGLTGLMNRRSFETTARQLVRQGGQFSVVMADLDHFKRVNDTLGHEAGDRALALFAEQLRTHLRGEDLLARYGGEEFVVLLPGAGAPEAVDVMDRFRARLAVATAANPPAFTSSFGVVEGRPTDSLAGLIRRADAALYRAKAQGRDCVVVDDTDPNAEPEHLGPSAMERALREDDPLADTVPLR